jgi:preprotein translocase subunit SecA
MQAVADEIVLLNIDPQKVIALSWSLSSFLKAFIFSAMSVVKIIYFFQPPKAWNLVKLLDEFVGLGGKLLSGNIYKLFLVHVIL